MLFDRPRFTASLMPALAAGCLAAAASPWSAAQVYDFAFIPASSGLAGTAGFSAGTNGTLIGNWDETANPTGTRTKPGIIGPFGPLENLPVPVSLSSSLGGSFSTQTAGGFRADLNTALGTIAIANYAADFLASGPLSLPATIGLTFDSFRTRSPDSLYIGGIPLEIPFGSFDISVLNAAQIAPALGTLTPIGPNAYSFTAVVPVELNASLDLLGTPLDFGSIPLTLTIAGQIALSGQTAGLTSLTPIGFDASLNPGVELPTIPFGLPTILPPGATANLLFDLTLDQIGTSLDTVLTATAAGVLIPAPGTAAGVAMVACLLVRRRR